MRWLAHSPSDSERGASGVLVAVMMLVLIGAGALAVDAGQIYVERAQLQNGADGAALAVAQVCHKTACSQSEANALAVVLLDDNANDGASALSGSVEMDVAGQWTVRTRTENGESGAGFLSKMFASALDVEPATVGAHATAGIEPVGSASGFPLALSEECWDLTSASETGELQRIAYKTPPDKGSTCTGPSGTQIPGGWGWLDEDGECEAASEVGSNTFGSDPGNDPPDGCSAVLDEWRSTILGGGEVKVPFPVFEGAADTGQGGTFTIIGYATFKMWGWKFGNNNGQHPSYEFRASATDPGMTTSLACTGADRCIIGQFVKFESIESSAGGPAGGANLGTVQIRLTQ